MNKGLLTILACTISTIIFSQSLSLDWFARMGNAGSDESAQVAIDASGNVYTVGHFNGTVDFDPGTGIFNLSSNGGFDIFIQKLDQNGNFLWAKSIGNPGNDFCYGISLDLNTNIFITGVFNGTVDFNPNAGIFNLTSNGQTDVYIDKLDSNGNFVWAKSVGGLGSDYVGRSIVNDLAGNVYVTGGFYNTVDFDPNSGVFNLVSNGDLDIFVLKLTDTGNFGWANKIGGSGIDATYGITLDPLGNVLFTGVFESTVDFDPSAAIVNHTSAGGYDVFVEKFDSNGSYIWVKVINGSGNSVARSICTDQSGNVYSAGQFDGVADFDPGAGINTLTSNGGYDMYIQKLTTDGDFLWVKSTGGGQNDIPMNLALDNSNNVYIGGVFQGAVDFDPGVTTYSLSSVGGNDAFIQKLDVNGDFLWAISYGNTGSDMVTCVKVDAANQLYVAGFFAGTIDFDPSSAVYNSSSNGGSRDAYVYKLGQCASSTGTDVQVACDAYTWINGITYTSSNSSAIYSLVNSTGCDSLITLNLTLNNSSQSTDPHVACESFIWIDGNTYTQSNSSASVLMTTTQGCDSTIVLNLTINTVDAGISQSGNVLMANQNGASYQWINCANNTAIIGEVGQSFTPTTNGVYAVTVTSGACVQTSNCVTISTIGLEANDAIPQFSVYPNPSNGQIRINGNVSEGMDVTIFNSIGQVVHAETKVADGEIIHLEGKPAGMYVIQVQSNSFQEVFKFVLN